MIYNEIYVTIITCLILYILLRLAENALDKRNGVVTRAVSWGSRGTLVNIKYPSKVKDINKLWADGYSIREISKATGVPKTTVHNYLKESQ